MKLSERMRVIGDRIEDLQPCRRNPERFHLELDEIRQELRSIIAQLHHLPAEGAGGQPHSR